MVGQTEDPREGTGWRDRCSVEFITYGIHVTSELWGGEVQLTLAGGFVFSAAVPMWEQPRQLKADEVAQREVSFREKSHRRTEIPNWRFRGEVSQGGE